MINYCQKDGNEVTPETVLCCYLTGIQCFFVSLGNAVSISNPMLDNPMKGVRIAGDSGFTHQFSRGFHVKSQTVLGTENLYREFSSVQLSEMNSVLFATQLHFVVALQTDLRRPELHSLPLSQVLENGHNEVKCSTVKGLLGLIYKTSKSTQQD